MSFNRQSEFVNHIRQNVNSKINENVPVPSVSNDKQETENDRSLYQGKKFFNFIFFSNEM
jgi:hypothetical protein